MKTIAVIERGKDGTYGVFAPDLENVIIGDGATVAEAKADFENTFAEVIAYFQEEGKELPEELRDVEFEYKYDIASLFNYLDFINVSKFAKWAGINATLMRRYKSCTDTYISAARAKQIEEALHRAGEELSAISL